MPSAARSWPTSERGAGRALGMRHVPGHQMIAEIGERIAERRQFPVEHRHDLRLVRRDDEIVEPVVAMHQPRRPARRNMRRQPFDQPLHGVDRFGLARRDTASTSGRPGARRSSRPCRNRRGRSPPDRTNAAARWSRSSRRRPRRARPGWSPASAAPRTRGRRQSSSRRTPCRRRSRRRKAQAARRPESLARAARGSRDIRGRPHAPTAAACRAACGAST